MEKNWTIAHESIEKSKILVNEFQTGIIENCESLNAYKNLIQRNAESMQERTDTDRASVILSADRLRKIVSDASVNHVEIVKQQRHKVADGLTEIGRKFENQAVESTEWNNRITAQLRTTQHQVNKFLVEDIRRDVPTGMTRAKREFQYPRKLVTTSPHERIIKRFRQTRKESEGSEDEQDLRLVSMGTPKKRQSGSPKCRENVHDNARKIKIAQDAGLDGDVIASPGFVEEAPSTSRMSETYSEPSGIPNVVLTEPTPCKTSLKNYRRSSRRASNKLEEDSNIRVLRNRIVSISPNNGNLRRSPRLSGAKKKNYSELHNSLGTDTDDEDNTKRRRSTRKSVRS